MTSSIEQFRKTIRVHMLDRPKVEGDQLREQLHKFHDFHAMSYPPGLTDEQIEEVARDIEHSYGIRAGFGSVVGAKSFEPWLRDLKSTIDPFYWSRYREYISREGLPKNVVISIDKVTEKVLSRLGNPLEEEVEWDRRGMVVGRVQSGKTANYIGLACKAADAGYKIIIVIAGISTNLRNQTQSRIDEGFIGRDTGRQRGKKLEGVRNVIGVGEIKPGRYPVSLTTTNNDFEKQTAITNRSEIDSYNVPIVLVIKKNHKSLENLIEWLRDNSAKGDREMIDKPMLLIDDEADNASINTNYSKQEVTKIEVTKINGQIRDLLKMFHRSSYVGYTATPFANIFIDPYQEDEMYKEDLFPGDFIIGLDTPSNYFSPTRIFVEGLSDPENPTWLRYILDNEDVLPISHRKGHEVDALPSSLIYALRTFIIARAIRNIRGDRDKHCSMLVNASRFIGVQGQIGDRLHEALESIQNAVRVHGSSGSAALDDHEMSALHSVWKDEYADVMHNWEVIQENLYNAASSARIVEINNKSNDHLDYTSTGKTGQAVIAVGGFGLSRGLTLEGLVVTWFLRNTMMYDTLLQMGRWFGYRDKYEDLCRIWMPPTSIEWYELIANAAEELHEELRRMEAVGATPKDFGLAVRVHPTASLLVTARNKMGAARKIATSVSFSNTFIETSRVSIIESDMKANIENARLLVLNLIKNNYIEYQEFPGDIFIPGVPVDFIDEFLSGWRNPEQAIIHDPDLIREYIKIGNRDQLRKWDVLIPSLLSGDKDNVLGIPVSPSNRAVSVDDLENHFMSFGGRKMRLFSRGVEMAGVKPSDIVAAKADYRKKKKLTDSEPANYPDVIFRQKRKRGLFVLQYVRPNVKSRSIGDCEDLNRTKVNLLPKVPVVGWGISFPVSLHPDRCVEYVINAVKQKKMFGSNDEDEDQESYYEAQ